MGGLELQWLRRLDLAAGTHPEGRRHVSAASGLVCHRGRVFVVGDDELHVAVFDGVREPGRLLRLYAGRLPSRPTARKRAKPDNEVLMHLPAGALQREAVLLVLGSGSAPGRSRAAWRSPDRIRTAGPGKRTGLVGQADLEPVYAPLRQRFGDLNVEGAFVNGPQLVLLQRGHAGGAPNASVVYDAAEFWRWLAAPAMHDTPTAKSVHEHALGQVDGVPLSFTDGQALADGSWLYAAVAEDTRDSVADGACVGSVIGWMPAQPGPGRQWALAGTPKAEGLALRERAGGIDFCLVSDADDAAIASQLWRGRLDRASA